MLWYHLNALLLAFLHVFDSSTFNCYSSAQMPSTSSVFASFFDSWSSFPPQVGKLCNVVLPYQSFHPKLRGYWSVGSQSMFKCGKLLIREQSLYRRGTSIYSLTACEQLHLILIAKIDLCYLQIFNWYHYGAEIGYTEPLFVDIVIEPSM